MEAVFSTARKKKQCGAASCEPAASAPSARHAPEPAPVAGLPRFLQWSPESQPLFVQTKLVVGAPGDAYEREADHVAKLAAGAGTGCSTCHGATTPCAACRPKEDAAPVSSVSAVQHAPEGLSQPKTNGGAAGPAPSVVKAVGESGSGSPLPAPVREKVEPVLGADLSDVRVHTDAAAHASARRLEAKAFTHQNHIWLGPHHSADDVGLMAHELAHVVQQTGRDAPPPQTLQREAEDSPGAEGAEVRERLQQRIDEALGDRAPGRTTPEAGADSTASGPASISGAESPAPATEDTEAREAARVTDRAALRERTEKLQPEVEPAVERVTEQQPRVEQAARSTVESLEQSRGGQTGSQQPPGRQTAGAAPAQGAQPQGAGAAAASASEGARAGAGGAAGGQADAAAVVRQAASAAGEAFAAAESQAVPDTPEVLTPPQEIAPVDAGGAPLPGDPSADAQLIELANDAQHLREQGQNLREYSAEERTNAQILRGNVGLVSQGIEGSQGGVQTAQGHLAFRQGLLEQSRQALGVSRQKAADVAARAPGGVAQTSENKARSTPLASESRDLSARNNASTPEDPEAAARAREQGGQLNRAGADAATIDDTLTQVQGASNTLVQDAARAAQLNTQASAGASAVEAALGRTEGRIAQMQGQNAAAGSQLDALRDQPADVASQAGDLDAQGHDLIQASRDIEARLHGTQQTYSEGMASVPAEAPPVEAGAEASAAEASPVESQAAVETMPAAVETIPAAVETSPAVAAPSASASPMAAPAVVEPSTAAETSPVVEAGGPEAAEEVEAVTPIEEIAPLVEGATTEGGAPPAENPPAEAPTPPPAEAEAEPPEDVLVQRTPEDGAAAPQPAAQPMAAPQPAPAQQAAPQHAPAQTAAAQPAAPQQSNINIASGLPSWLTGEPAPNEAERQRQQREQDERRRQEIVEINNELRGRRFEQLSAGERRRIALRLTTRNLFGGVGQISWPTPGGIARGAAHLAAGLIDPRAPMMGVVSGLNMIINSGVNFARQPSWGGALRSAAGIATGLTIILGSITALAGVIAALMTAITIVTLGVAAPITGPVIAFCASVMTVVGGWTFWVGLIAAGLQALTFLVDLYMAGTAQTAEELQQQSERMREDASNAGNALMQAGMGRLAAVGGRAMQAEIRAFGGGVRFAARMGTRAAAAPGRALGAVRSAGSRAVSGARALPGRVVAGARALPGRVVSGARSLGGRAATGARGLGGRALTGARELGGRALTGARELGSRARTGARELGTRALTGASEVAGGAARLPGRVLRGARELPGRIGRQFRTGVSTLGGRAVAGARSLATGAVRLPGRIVRGARELPGRIRQQFRIAADARDAARRELAAEARAARRGAAAEVPPDAAPPTRPNEPPVNAQEREFLDSTSHKSGSQISDAELRAERNIADRAERRRVNDDPFVEEADLPNGHRERYTRDGTGCRFSPGPGDCIDANGQRVNSPADPTAQPAATGEAAATTTTAEAANAEAATEAASAGGRRQAVRVEANTLDDVERLKNNPPQRPAGVAEGDAQWQRYQEYYREHLDELEAHLRNPSANAAPPAPRTWDSYSEFRGPFQRGTGYQSEFANDLRAQRPGMVIGENVGVAKRGGGTTKFPDQFEYNPVTRQARTYSNKSRDFSALQDLEGTVEADVRQALNQYGGAINVRRPGDLSPTQPGVSLHGETVTVREVTLVYDSSLAPAHLRPAIEATARAKGAELFRTIRISVVFWP